MNELYKTGSYTVRSEKLDDCPPFEDAKAVETLTALSTGILVVIAFCMLLVGIVVPSPHDLWVGLGYLLVIILIDGVIFCLIAGNMNRCGVKFMLDVEEHSRWRDHTIRQKYYQFGNNSEIDAHKIRMILESFKADANKRAAFDEAEALSFATKREEQKKKSEECCMRYKEVMQKVKTE
jgi:hypothetical protein